MALEFLTKEFFVGVAAAIPAALGGWAAYGRMRSSNNAQNANDAQQVNMLKVLSEENRALKETIKEKDAQIREYFEASVKAESRLEALEQSMTYILKQNTDLTNQVRELTQSNQSLTLEVSHLRSSLRS